VPSRVTVLPVVVRAAEVEVERRVRRDRMEWRLSVVEGVERMVESIVMGWVEGREVALLP